MFSNSNQVEPNNVIKGRERDTNVKPFVALYCSWKHEWNKGYWASIFSIVGIKLLNLVHPRCSFTIMHIQGIPAPAVLAINISS